MDNLPIRDCIFAKEVGIYNLPSNEAIIFIVFIYSEKQVRYAVDGQRWVGYLETRTDVYSKSFNSKTSFVKAKISSRNDIS